MIWFQQLLGACVIQSYCNNINISKLDMYLHELELFCFFVIIYNILFYLNDTYLTCGLSTYVLNSFDGKLNVSFNFLSNA